MKPTKSWRQRVINGKIVYIDQSRPSKVEQKGPYIQPDLEPQLNSIGDGVHYITSRSQERALLKQYDQSRLEDWKGHNMTPGLNRVTKEDKRVFEEAAIRTAEEFGIPSD